MKSCSAYLIRKTAGVVKVDELQPAEHPLRGLDENCKSNSGLQDDAVLVDPHHVVMVLEPSGDPPKVGSTKWGLASSSLRPVAVLLYPLPKHSESLQ